MSGYLVDTSIFVAVEQGRPLREPPDGEARISVATLTELDASARSATSPELREFRTATLVRARRFVPLAYDEPVAAQLAGILATARDRGRRVGLMDAIVAATALAHDLTVWTQDDDFEALAVLAPGLRLHR